MGKLSQPHHEALCNKGGHESGGIVLLSRPHPLPARLLACSLDCLKGESMRSLSTLSYRGRTLYLLLSLVITSSVAQAQTIADAQQLLSKGDRSSVETGIQTIGLVGTAQGVPLLTARIEQGLPEDLLDSAIITLSAIADPAATPTLIKVASHRRPEIRESAMSALAVIGGEGAYEALIKGLSDADDNVRAAAATALGDLGAIEAATPLFNALDHGNLAASGAIGKVTTNGDVPRLLEFVGKLPLHALEPAFLELLRRSDIKSPTKTQVVNRVAELATPEARRFLTDAVGSIGKEMGQPVSRAALRAAKEIPE